MGLDGTQVVTALTATAARVCGVGDRKGHLAPVYDADVLAVAGEPIRDPSALRDVRGVWCGGRAVATTVLR